MAGKYSKVDLPQFEQDISYQEKVTTRSLDMGLEGMSAGELGQLFQENQKYLDEAEDEVSKFKLTKEAITQELIKAMEEDDITSFKMSDGTLLYQQVEPYSSVVDKEAYLAWIKKNKYEGLLSVPYQSTNALTKELLIRGENPPAGVTAFMKTMIRHRKGK